MSDVSELVERLRARAFRIAAREFNGDGAMLAKEAADMLERLEADLARAEKVVGAMREIRIRTGRVDEVPAYLVGDIYEIADRALTDYEASNEQD